MSKKQTLDPVSNAKTLAFLFFLLAFLRLVDLINGDGTPTTLSVGVLFLVIGLGLRQQKLWGVYMLGVLALLTLVAIGTYGINAGMVATFLVFAGLFAWFYSAKDKFKK